MWIILVLFFIGLVVLFLAGPRVPVDTTIRPINVPEDPDAYLRETESRFNDITPGAEKTIIWADPQRKQKTPLSIIYLHGFTATRQETAPLADVIAKALHANLFYTRLAGHGRKAEALASVAVNDWLNDTVEALEIGRKIGEKVIVIGTSTGGTLAAWLLASPYARDILTGILISPNFMPCKPETRVLTWPWARQVIPPLFGATRHWTEFNERHAIYWTQDFPTVVAIPMMGLVQMVRKLDFSRIQQPVLTVFSRKDQVVRWQDTEAFCARFGSAIKQQEIVDDSQDPNNHVIAGDILSPNTTARLARRVEEFVKTILAVPRTSSSAK